MLSYYTIAKNSKIVLYGAGLIGQQVRKVLKREGFFPTMFIDKRANELKEVDGLPVLSMKEFLNLTGASDTVVIVCLNNGNQQEMVAHQLFEEGLHKIVYLPMIMGLDAERRHFRRRCYSNVMQGNNISEQRCLYLTDDDFKPFGAIDNAAGVFLIAYTQKTVTFWCNCEVIRSCGAALYQKITARNGRDVSPLFLKYAEQSIREHTPYQELFKFLRGEENNIELYLAYMGQNSMEKRSMFLEDRKSLYIQFEQAFQYEPQFFTDSPSFGVWNSNGYVNLIDGMHRAQYLLSKGRKEIPVRVIREDFNKIKKILH